MKKHVGPSAPPVLASALSILCLSADAQIGGIDSRSHFGGQPTAIDASSDDVDVGTSIGVIGSEPSDGLAASSLDIRRTILGFGSTPVDSMMGSTSTSTLTPPSSLLGPLDLGTNPPFSSFGRFLPGVGSNASGTSPSPRLPISSLGSTTSSLNAPSSLLGPLDLGTNPPFTSFGRFLPGVGANASGTRSSPRLPSPGAAPSAAAPSAATAGGVVWDSFCDPQDFTCDE